MKSSSSKTPNMRFGTTFLSNEYKDRAVNDEVLSDKVSGEICYKRKVDGKFVYFDRENIDFDNFLLHIKKEIKNNPDAQLPINNGNYFLATGIDLSDFILETNGDIIDPSLKNINITSKYMAENADLKKCILVNDTEKSDLYVAGIDNTDTIPIDIGGEYENFVRFYVDSTISGEREVEFNISNFKTDNYTIAVRSNGNEFKTVNITEPIGVFTSITIPVELNIGQNTIDLVGISDDDTLDKDNYALAVKYIQLSNTLDGAMGTHSVITSYNSELTNAGSNLTNVNDSDAIDGNVALLSFGKKAYDDKNFIAFMFYSNIATEYELNIRFNKSDSDTAIDLKINDDEWNVMPVSSVNTYSILNKKIHLKKGVNYIKLSASGTSDKFINETCEIKFDYIEINMIGVLSNHKLVNNASKEFSISNESDAVFIKVDTRPRDRAFIDAVLDIIGTDKPINVNYRITKYYNSGVPSVKDYTTSVSLNKFDTIRLDGYSDFINVSHITFTLLSLDMVDVYEAIYTKSYYDENYSNLLNDLKDAISEITLKSCTLGSFIQSNYYTQLPTNDNSVPLMFISMSKFIDEMNRIGIIADTNGTISSSSEPSVTEWNNSNVWFEEIRDIGRDSNGVLSESLTDALTTMESLEAYLAVPVDYYGPLTLVSTEDGFYVEDHE